MLRLTVEKTLRKEKTSIPMRCRRSTQHILRCRIIDRTEDTIIFKGDDSLKLGPKYGNVIVASNPMNSDILAISPSTGKFLSWNQTQAEDMIKTGGVIYDVKETDAGVQPAYVAIDSKAGEIYIINPTLNAVMKMDSNRTES